jgi:hypothetical protein
MTRPNKDYLGDAVYADLHDCGGVELTCEDGVQVYEDIVLEPEVLEALLRYLERHKAVIWPEKGGKK